MKPTIEITIQEYRGPYGKYWSFDNKQSGFRIAEVDKRKGQRDYEIFYENAKIGKRTNRLPAMMYAMDTIIERLPHVNIRFRQSVVVIKEK